MKNKLIISALVCLISSGAIAKQRLHGEAAQISSQCTQHFTRAETKYGIPKHLLLAIANTESGRYNDGLRRVLPWPWTLNIEGAGSYHANMHDAVTAVNRAKQSGKSSIDVGCMQVNLKHHPKAFASVFDALTPAKNIDYAASFLRSNFDELGSWPKAIAAYHSRSAKGGQYFAMVQKRWRDVRGLAGGNLLENTDYMVAKSELVNGVKVSRFLSDNQPKRQLIKPPSPYSLSVRDNSFVTNNPEIKAKRISVSVNMSKNNATARKSSGMKVIRVSEVMQARDDTVVTITPTANRSNAQQFVRNAQSFDEISDQAIANEPPKDPNNRHQPNFIFGRN